MNDLYRGYYIHSGAAREPETGLWKPWVSIVWIEQGGARQKVFRTAHFTLAYATETQADACAHSFARTWIDDGRPELPDVP